MLKMYVVKNSIDSKQDKDPDDISVHDEGDGLCIGLNHKAKMKKEISEDSLSLKDTQKMKKDRRRSSVCLDRKETTVEGDAECNTVTVQLQTDIDNITNELRTCDDSNDEERSQRICLIKGTKPQSNISDEMYNEKTTHSNNRDEFRDLKVVLAVLIGLILGGALFLVLHYCFGYAVTVAGGISGGITLVMCVMAVVSVHARCVVVLIIVGVFTGKGRAVLLCVITGIVMSGPMINISHNVGQVMTTMSCFKDLAYNQSLALHRSLEMPLQDVERQLYDMAARAKHEAEVLREELDVIKDGVVSVTDGVDQANEALHGATMACKESLQGTFKQCEALLSGTRQRCRDELSKLDPGKTVQKIIETLNPEGWFGRRKRVSTHPAEVRTDRHIRKRRGLEDVCNVFDIGDVCSGLLGADFCQPVTFADDMINNAIMDILNQIHRIQKFFDFTLIDIRISGGNNSRSSPHLGGVQHEVKSKLDVLKFVVSIINKCLSMFMLLLVLQAWLYKRKYLTNIQYDNIYITDQMRDIDASRLERKLEGVLPLRKHEKESFVDSTTRTLPSERQSRCLSLAPVLMHMVVVILLVFVDYVFYYILLLLSKEGQERNSRDVQLGLEVVGSGPVAGLFQTFVNGFNSQQLYYTVTNVQHCLPRLYVPDQKTAIALIFMYVLTFAMTMFKSYGLRLRPKIAAFYFPLQEAARGNYLHKTIVTRRHSVWEDRKQMMSTCSVDGKLDKEVEWKSSRSVVKYPSRKLRISCLQCGKKVSKVWTCDVSTCNVVLCRGCYRDVGEQCPLCTISETYVG